MKDLVAKHGVCVDDVASRISSPKSPDECALWMGCRTSSGYGQFRDLYAHRLSYFFFVGEIPDGYFVCHHCDNPSCVNPFHLFVGTAGDNVRDAKRKGRTRNGNLSGEAHGMARLTWDDVNEIRRLYREERLSQRTIATRFPVTHHMVYRIVSGKNWIKKEAA